MSSQGIPVIDLRDHGADAATHSRFVKTLGEGLERFGFVAVQGHGIPPTLLRQAYGAAQKAFDLPRAVKATYETPENGRQRGYTSMYIEHAVDVEQPDLKEFWHVGRSLAPDHSLHISGDVPPNLMPAEVRSFEPVFQNLFLQMEDFANRLLDGVGEYLGLPDDFFRDMVTDGNSILRLINYPDLSGVTVPPGAVRAAAHEDINLITVLPASTRPGLELLTREGEWMPVNAPPDVMVCDTGDMMALLTGGRLPATTHRVVNPPGADGGRMSMPFFLHPHPDHVLKPLWGEGRQVTARDFLRERLEAIGVA